jgi:hypothetical protein
MRSRIVSLLTASAALALTLAALAPAALAQLQAGRSAFAIGNGGTTLITFDVANPLGATAIGNFNVNGSAAFLDAIDFRPVNSLLYGYSDLTDTLYTVDLATAALTPVASGLGASATNTFFLGMDFNPTIDRVRVVTDSTQNLVYNPNSAAPPAVTTPLFYPAGDPGANSALGPRVIENAYSNNIASQFGGLGTTTQYGIDYGTDTLVIIANNTGAVTTVGGLGLDVNDTQPFVGLDIFTSADGTNTTYAIFDTTAGGTAPGLYTINLGTGAATRVGGIGGGFNQVYSLAVAPVVPEPGAVAALGIFAAGTLGLMARARRRQQPS